MKLIFLGFLLTICTNFTIANPIEFYITNSPDSISIFDAGNKLAAKVLWGYNAINGQNDIIQAEVKSYYLIPPSTGARNYSLSMPILLQPKNISTIKFHSYNVRIRIYADTSVFRLLDLSSHVGAYKVIEQDSIYFRYDEWHIANITQNFVEFYLDSISTNNHFLISAVNILMGIVNEGDLSELISDPVLIPVTKFAVLNEGVRFESPNFSGINVEGSLSCIGTESNPINLELWIETNGSADSSFLNNEDKFNCIYTYCHGLIVKWSNASSSNSSFSNIQLSNYSKSTLSNIKLDILWCNDSKVSITESRFNYGGHIYSSKSIVKVESCYFEYYNNESEHHDSFLYFKNNQINSDAFLQAIKPLRCLVIFDSNNIFYAGEPGQNGNRVGIGIWADNYAIIKQNIIVGFRSGVEIGYNNKAILYNNNFVYNGTGIEVYATPDTIGIYNNIFVNYGIPIDLDYSTYAGGTNVAYINNNLWDELGAYYSLINNPDDSSIVIGNEISIHADPLFVDTINYKLSENSPAIDEGTRVISSFSYIFEVLDTIIVVPDTIIINDYWGSGPDIGAIEYDPSSYQNYYDNNRLPAVFYLTQNYPNPFNPSTKISYQLPVTSDVTLKVFDLLGGEVAVLVNEEKSAGNYEVEFEGTELPSGIYFYQLKAGQFSETKKMILLK